MAELNELVLVGCPGSEVTVCLVHGRGDGGGEDGVVACRAPTTGRRSRQARRGRAGRRPTLEEGELSIWVPWPLEPVQAARYSCISSLSSVISPKLIWFFTRVLIPKSIWSSSRPPRQHIHGDMSTGPPQIS